MESNKKMHEETLLNTKKMHEETLLNTKKMHKETLQNTEKMHKETLQNTKKMHKDTLQNTEKMHKETLLNTKKMHKDTEKRHKDTLLSSEYQGLQTAIAKYDTVSIAIKGFTIAFLGVIIGIILKNNFSLCKSIEIGIISSLLVIAFAMYLEGNYKYYQHKYSLRVTLINHYFNKSKKYCSELENLNKIMKEFIPKKIVAVNFDDILNKIKNDNDKKIIESYYVLDSNNKCYNLDDKLNDNKKKKLSKITESVYYTSEKMKRIFEDSFPLFDMSLDSFFEKMEITEDEDKKKIIIGSLKQKGIKTIIIGSLKQKIIIGSLKQGIIGSLKQGIIGSLKQKGIWRLKLLLSDWPYYAMMLGIIIIILILQYNHIFAFLA
jgi:hypothetical protein